MKTPLRQPIVYLITPGRSTPENFNQNKAELIEQITAAVDSGVSMVQIREKHLTASQVFEIATAAVYLARDSETAIIINDRFDIAIAAGADGVHLTANSIPADVVRRFVPKGFLIGVSTHSPSEVTAAYQNGADFAVYGPVFASPEKGEPIGVEEFLTVATNNQPFPVIALGGIDTDNWLQLIDTGAAGIAAIRLFEDRTAMKEICRIAKDLR